MSNKTYKELQESFVSSHSGTSVAEVALASSISAVSLLLRDVLVLSRFSPTKWVGFLIDFTCLILPSQLTETVLAENITVLLVLMLLISMMLAIITLESTVKEYFSWSGFSSFLNSDTQDRKQFLTNFRAFINILTALSILAVDFTVFPRRFAKAETYGTGLMDAGVGLFIFSNAIVSPEARNLQRVHGPFKNIWKSFLSCVPLLILGVIRLIAIKGTDYQEHVTEYGVHWNFFFTLAAVKILSSMVYSALSTQMSGVFGIILIVGYEYLLSGCGLRDYIVEGHDGKGGRQSGLLDANREGIYSSLGYLSLYFLGIQLGQYIFKKRTKITDYCWLLLVFAVVTVLGYAMMELAVMSVDKVSRRFANLSFVLWMVGQAMMMITSYLLIEIMVDYIKHINFLREKKTDHEKHAARRNDKNKPCLLKAINYNGLFFFLLSNLLTGIINFSVHTLYATPMQACALITVYMAVSSSVTMTLYYKKVQLKFW
ncbi:hypothetical protein ScPMuIL_006971 [Solemya velum]